MSGTQQLTFVEEVMRAVGEVPTRAEVLAVLRKWAGGRVYINAQPLRTTSPSETAHRLIFNGVTRTDAVEALRGRGVSARHARRVVGQAVATRGQTMAAYVQTLDAVACISRRSYARTTTMATTAEKLQAARAEYKDLVMALSTAIGRINVLTEVHRRETMPAAAAAVSAEQQPLRLPTMGAFGRSDGVIVSGAFVLTDDAPQPFPPGFVVQTNLGFHLANAVARSTLDGESEPAANGA